MSEIAIISSSVVQRIRWFACLRVYVILRGYISIKHILIDQKCGKSPFARVEYIIRSPDQSIPGEIENRFRGSEVLSVGLSTDFSLT